MGKTVSIHRNFVIFGVPLVLLVGLIFIMKYFFLKGDDTLGLAITIDLLLVVPLVYYLLIRNTDIPKTTVVPVMILGLLIGTHFLPQENQTYFDLFKQWALPLIELSILSFIVFKIRKARKAYKRLKTGTPDFFDVLKNACKEILPRRAVMPFATEVAVFYYGFIDWSKRTYASNEFTYHRKSGSQSLFGGLIMIILIETVALHFLLNGWNTVLAWIFTCLSFYTLLQLFGFARALAKRPISIENDTLVLRYSIMQESRIRLEDIESIIISKAKLEKNSTTRYLSPLPDLESHNVIIQLNSTGVLIGLYGFRKSFKTLALHVDDPKHFKDVLDAQIQAK